MGGLLLVLKVGPELEKRKKYGNRRYPYDLATVLVFLGIAMTPRAILKYFALREEKQPTG
jgi:hypothetical protein